MIKRFCVLFAVLPIACAAQLQPQKKDPLSKLQPPQGAAACSATDLSSCAEAAAKILPQVLGDSPMAENLRRLTDEIGGRVTGTPQMAKAVEWGVVGFRAAGVDVHTEKYTLPVTWSEGATRLELIEPAQFLCAWSARVGRRQRRRGVSKRRSLISAAEVRRNSREPEI